jgi:hypothetical protein
MENNTEITDRLDAVIELIENLIVLEALKTNISGGAIRKFLRVDMNRVTGLSKMLKAARKR